MDNRDHPQNLTQTCIHPIKIKKHGRPNKSLFRFGLGFLFHDCFQPNLNGGSLSIPLSFFPVHRLGFMV